MFDKDNKFGFINNNNNSNNSDIKKYVDDKITVKILPVDYNKNCVTNVAVGRKLNTNAPKENNRGAMIIGQGGTLADDTRFAISTSNITCTEMRYPFEAKEDGSTYLRGKNVLLETENDIVEDKSIVTKKYVDDKISSSPQLSFNASGELVVTINGVSKTFVPKE